MADETIRVVYDVTERGMTEVRRMVADIRKGLGESGADMGQFESRLNRIEKSVQQVTTALRSASTQTSQVKKGITGWNESMATVWKRQYQEAQKAAKAILDVRAAQDKLNGSLINSGLSTANSGIAAASKQQRSSLQNRLSSARSTQMADWDKEFAAASVSAKRFEDAQGNIIAQRYALYDVANTYALIGTALAGAAIYAGVVGARFESAFTNVERTLQGGTLPAEVDEIRQSLIRLSSQIPLTFQELAQIATIGNQMGIAKEDIVDFTSTIARFASVSGMSIDAVTKAFGGFAAQTGLDPAYFENLGAAIAKVGIDSNATEEQIVGLLREITAGAKGAGFTADAIVGLSGTLAGLQIAPERARGALDTYFGTLDRAVANGGQDLENFALVVGVTADELERMVRNGEGAEVMRGFLVGLNGAEDSVALTQALDALNLQQLRVSNTFKRLSGDLSIFDRDQRNANTAFMEGAELTRQYAMTVDDLASQWTIFINNINAFINAVSGGAVPGLAALFTVINGVVSAINEWLGDNRAIAGLLAFIGAVGGALGVILLFRAASMSATAALLAMRVLTQQAGGAAIVASGGFRGLIGTLFGVRTAAGAAAGGIFTLRSAIRALLASTGIGLLVTLGGTLLDGLIGQGSAANDASLSMAEYNKAVSAAAKSSGDGADGANQLADSLSDGGGGGVGGAAESAAAKVRTLVDYVNDLTGVFKRSSDIRFGSTAAMDDITLKWIELNDQAEEYQRTIRSLTADRELQNYWLGIAELYDDQIRAGQLREGIAKIDDEMAEAQQGANRELKGNSRAAIENRQTMRGLLGSYEEYVSALAAAGASQEEIQNVLSSLNGDFTTQAQALGFAGDELVTYQARFSDLATIVAAVPRNITVAFNGDPALQALNEFFAKATEAAGAAGGGMGNALGAGLADSFNDPVFSDFSLADKPWFRAAFDVAGTSAGGFFTDATREQFRSFGAGAIYDAMKAIFGPGEGLAKVQGDIAGKGFNTEMSAALLSSDPITQRLLAQQAVANQAAYNAGDSAGTSFNNGLLTALDRARNAFTNALNGTSFNGLGPVKFSPVGGWASGGYTGPGHWLQPAGVVHKGEYVIPKQYVNQSTGLPDMNYVSSLTKSKSAGPGYATGGHVAGGGVFPNSIELGPMSLNYIAHALQVRLSVGSRELANASSQGDKQLAWAGSN